MNIPPPPKAAALLVILHDELIVEVLTFLEVKSLMRMKCVCKSWKTLFSDPVFVKMHLKRQSTRITHLALLSNKSEGSGDCRAVPISLLLESTSSSITLTDDYPYYRFNYKNAGGIIGSCNGLVCLQGCSSSAEYTDHSFSFWNPATRTISETLISFRQYRNPRDNICRFVFGYDNSTDTYNVVVLCFKINGSLMTARVRVFTLGDNVWRDIDSFPVEFVFHPFCLGASDVVYMNNCINWFARHRYDCHLKNLTVEQFVIISFELETMTHTKLLLPRCCDEELRDDPPILPPSLSMFNDCLCLSYDFKKTHYIIWQMKEFGVDESWVQFLKISYLNLQMDYNLRELEYNYIPELIVRPLCVSENGDTLIFAINRKDQTILYNWRDNKVKRIKGTNEIWWFGAKGYVESLVSTC